MRYVSSYRMGTTPSAALKPLGYRIRNWMQPFPRKLLSQPEMEVSILGSSLPQTGG
jgi:uncharacterized protein YbgA (DUF1722 family)